MKSMSRKNNRMKKYLASSQMFLIVMSLFAFSFVVSESNLVAADVPPPNTPIPAKFIEKVSSAATTQKVVTFEGQNYLVTKGALEAGKDVSATNLVTGKVGTLTLSDDVLKTVNAATAVQAKYGGTVVKLVNGDATTLAHVLDPNSGLGLSSISEESLKASKITNIDPITNSFTIDGVKNVIGADGALTSQNIKTISIFGETFTGVTAHLLQGALWAGGIITAIQLLGPMFGLSPSTISAASKSTLVGVAVWKGLDIFSTEVAGNLKFLPESCLKDLGVGLGWCSAGAGLAVGLLTFILLYKKEEEKVVNFTCVPWQAPVGGSSCEECNNQGSLGCSLYQCRSLGQACDIINPGTAEEKCVWVNRQDVNPPTIEPLNDALLNNYKYAPDSAISPPDRGVKINYLKANDNCIPAFTPLQFGVKLNEPASCRVDVLRKGNFSEMSSFMSGGLLRYNHTYALSLPGASNLQQENITVQNDGNYALYVRCQDANGNSNPATFVFKYCVDPGPDTTPAVIVATSIVNNNPIAFNQSSVDLEVYTNEPASCRWSHNDQSYNDMNQQMQCSTSIFEANSQSLYKCSTTLTGLKDKTDNKFYFRCKDQPLAPDTKRNENSESYVFTLKGTQPLVIDSVSPDNETTVRDSTSPVKVKINATTSSGFDQGKAICYYSPTGNEESYIKFFETDSFKHSQDLFLTEGDYNYFIKCTDLGGNSDYEQINFSVETDTSPPAVVRAYKEENYLKLITVESAECVYSAFGCNYAFSEGTPITALDDKKVHFTDWSAQKDIFVKCQDDFGNQPLPDSCSIVVRAASKV